MALPFSSCFLVCILSATLSKVSFALSSISKIEIGLLVPSTSVFDLQLQWDQIAYFCEIRPNATTASCAGDDLRNLTGSYLSDSMMMITHTGSASSTTLVISSITLTEESTTTTQTWNEFCSCLNDAYATQYAGTCMDGQNKWNGVCMSGAYTSTCGIYAWPALSLTLDPGSTEITVDTTTSAYTQNECDSGYVDITNGNTNYWECGENCAGGQYVTDGVCNCACIRDECQNIVLEYDGFKYWWVILIAVILLLCWCKHKNVHNKRQLQAQQMANVEAAQTQANTEVRRRPVIGDGGTVMCSNSHPLVYTSKTALLDTSPGYGTGFICDLCRVHNKTDGSYHCRTCKFDLCSLCYGYQQRNNPPPVTSSSSMVTCPQSHALSYTTAAGLVQTNAAYSNGFICNQCRVSHKNTASYHCVTCQYDLCSSCYSAANNALTASVTIGAAPPTTNIAMTSTSIAVSAPPGYAMDEEQAPPPAYQAEALPSYQDMGEAPPAYESVGNEGAGTVTNY